jgi:hypothetical protein
MSNTKINLEAINDYLNNEIRILKEKGKFNDFFRNEELGEDVNLEDYANNILSTIKDVLNLIHERTVCDHDFLSVNSLITRCLEVIPLSEIDGKEEEWAVVQSETEDVLEINTRFSRLMRHNGTPIIHQYTFCLESDPNANQVVSPLSYKQVEFPYIPDQPSYIVVPDNFEEMEKDPEQLKSLIAYIQTIVPDYTPVEFKYLSKKEASE